VNYHGPAEGIASSASEKPAWGIKRPAPPWLIIVNVSGLSNEGGPLVLGAQCDPHQHFWPVCSCSPPRLRGPIAASSSSPTRRTVTVSTNASPGAKNAARMPPGPIASRGISPRPRLTGASSQMRSRGRSLPRVRTAIMPVAASTSPLPASAEHLPGKIAGGRSATSAPRKRRDDAPRSGYVKPRWPCLPAFAA
jgi:hypothetical protein